MICLQRKFDEDFRKLIEEQRAKAKEPNPNDMTEEEYEVACKEFAKKRMKEENVLK